MTISSFYLSGFMLKMEIEGIVSDIVESQKTRFTIYNTVSKIVMGTLITFLTFQARLPLKMGLAGMWADSNQSKKTGLTVRNTLIHFIAGIAIEIIAQKFGALRAYYALLTFGLTNAVCTTTFNESDNRTFAGTLALRAIALPLGALSVGS